MRITNNIIQQRSIATVQRGLSRMSEAQDQVSSGIRVAKASDDPTAAAGIIRSGSSLRALEQYHRNVSAASSRASAEESVLDQVTDVLGRARELAIAAGGSPDETTYAAAKAEVDQLLEFAVGLGNTRFDDGYLFGGDRSDTAPFPTSAPPYTGATGRHEVEIASGLRILANHNASEVFVDTGVLQSLKDFSDALGARDQPGVTAAAGKLKDAFDGVQDLLGDVGARTNQMQVTAANLDALEVNLRTFKSDLEDVDFEKAVTELVGRQTAVQAAMMAASKVMGLTLADYLR